jgi:glycosyltransferase involved in cell wall biosynthesis
MLSIIIPVKPNDTTIQSCLESLAGSSFSNFEVCLVLDGWDDHGVMQWPGRQPFRKFCHPKSGPSACRHFGAEMATGEWVCFIDSDVLVHPDTLQKALDILSESKDDGLTGSYDDEPSVKTLCSRFRNLLHHFHHQQNKGATGVFWGAFSVMRRADYLCSGGFDARAYSKPSIEDIELGYRLQQAGLVIRLEPTVQVKHLKRWTLKNMIQTDIFLRAKPWTELLIRMDRKPDNLLNARRLEKATAIVMLLGWASLLLSWSLQGLLLLWAVFLLAFIAIQHRFYRFAASKFSPLQMPAVFIMHNIYYVSAIMGFALGQISARLTKN